MVIFTIFREGIASIHNYDHFLHLPFCDQVIRDILAADDTRVKFVNDLLTDADDEEEF